MNSKGGEPQLEEIDSDIEWYDLICEYVETQISNITKQVREAEKEPMIRTNKSSNGGKRMPQNGLPNLTIANLSVNKMLFTILDAWEPEGENKYGFAVVVKIELNNGPRFLWNLKASNPNCDVLIEALGEDEKKWIDRTGYIFLKKNPRDEKLFPTCEIIPPEKTKKKGDQS